MRRGWRELKVEWCQLVEVEVEVEVEEVVEV
jgi:hypothetical protein